MHSGAQGLACFAYPWCILLQMSDLMFLPWPSAFLQYLVPLLLEKGSLGLGLDAPKLEISQVVPGSPKNELCAALTYALPWLHICERAFLVSTVQGRAAGPWNLLLVELAHPVLRSSLFEARFRSTSLSQYLTALINGFIRDAYGKYCRQFLST